MEADNEYCHRCNAETHWIPTRGGKRLKCSQCKEVWPCYTSCKHLDCKAVRAENKL